MIRKLTMFMCTMMVIMALAACGGNQNGSANSAKGDTPKTTQSGSSSKSEGKSGPSAPKTKGLVSKDKIVAVVNGKKIKGEKYNNVLQQVEINYQKQGQDPTSDKVYKQAKKQALNAVVGTELILQDADKKGYQPSDKKLTQQVTQAEKQFGGKKKFKKLLKQQNMTLDQYKKAMVDQMEFNTYLNKEIPVKVTDKEIQAVYEQYKSNTKKPQKLSKIKPQIKSSLERQKQNTKVSEVIDKLREKADINIKI